MNIDNIREDISYFLNKKCHFIYYGCRGQAEDFFGEINKVYSRVFTIITIDGYIKCFSFSDFAIKNIKITSNNWKILIFLKYYYKINS